VYLNNQIHGCLAFGTFDIQFDINKHLLIEGYRICPTNISLNHLVYVQINTKCRTKCLIGCKEIHFENYNKFSRILDKNSTTKRIYVIPIKRPHIEYFEELRIDFDQLLYTCGGIVGLWFGLSPNQISNLFSIIWH